MDSQVFFNQNATCFAITRENGFAVYNVEPITRRFVRQAPVFSGIGLVAMLYKSNIFALVGSDPESKEFPPNKVVLWDDLQGTRIAEFDFHAQVEFVKMRRDTIMIIVKNKTFIYNFSDLKLVKNYDTCPNPKGLGELSQGINIIAAILGIVPGTVLIEDFSLPSQKIVNCHTNPITSISLSLEGEILATASERGTLIRIWSTTGNKLVKELRRGLEVTQITSISFNHDSSQVAVCSDKETCHIFNLQEPNVTSSLYYLTNYLPQYFSSEWSPLTFPVPPGSIVHFAPESSDTLYILTRDNIFKKYVYNIRTGTSKCIETTSLQN